MKIRQLLMLLTLPNYTVMNSTECMKRPSLESYLHFFKLSLFCNKVARKYIYITLLIWVCLWKDGVQIYWLIQSNWSIRVASELDSSDQQVNLRESYIPDAENRRKIIHYDFLVWSDIWNDLSRSATKNNK